MSTLLDRVENWLQNETLERLLIIAIGVLVILVVSSFIKKQLNRRVQSSQNKYKARKFVSFSGYFFMVVLILLVYNDKIGNIGTALGVVGAGIAFALQEVIISLAGWVSITLTNSLGVGQRVKIGDVKGDVIDIGVLSTTIMEVGDWVHGDLYNGRIVTLANSFVFKEKIHNYSAEYPFLWDELTVPISTESDYRKAQQLFEEILESICGDYAKQSLASWQKLANKYRVEVAQVAPMVTKEFDENWITFTLRYIVDYKRRRSTKDEIYTRLLDEISKRPDIEIAATSLEISKTTS